MNIRAAEPADADEVATVNLESRRAYVAHAPMIHEESDVRRWIRDVLLPSTRSHVAEIDGVVVGFVSFDVREGIGWIEQLYVAPGRTGIGIGSALLEVALQNLPGIVHLYTFQESAGARRFYERHGFKAITFTEGADNEERCPDVLYRLENNRPNQTVQRTRFARR